MPVIKSLLRTKRLALAQRRRHPPPIDREEWQVVRLLGVDLAAKPSETMIGIVELQREIQSRLVAAFTLPPEMMMAPQQRRPLSVGLVNQFLGSLRPETASRATYAGRP